MATAQPLPFDPIAEARRQWTVNDWGEPAAMAAATSIMRAQQLVLRRVDSALAPFGLTFARYEVLALLALSRRGELPMGKIGVRLMVHPASVTNAVDRLAAAGLVRRVAHPTDGAPCWARSPTTAASWWRAPRRCWRRSGSGWRTFPTASATA